MHRTSNSTVDARETATDATATVIALAVVVRTLRRSEDGLSVPAALLGAVSTVAFEAVAGRHHDRVRSLWEPPVVRGGSLACFAVGWRSLARRWPSPVSSVAIGALVTYLALVAAVVVGVLPAPRKWTHRDCCNWFPSDRT